MIIRHLKPEDVGSILRVARAASAKVQSRESIEWLITCGDCYAALQDGKIVNYILSCPWKRIRFDRYANASFLEGSVIDESVIEEWAAIPGDVQYIVDLVTMEDFEGHDFESHIWEAMISEFLPGIVWVAEVTDDTTLAMYERFGFKVSGNYKHYRTVIKT